MCLFYISSPLLYHIWGMLSRKRKFSICIKFILHQFGTTFLADGVLVGLAAAQSCSRSDSPPDCHAHATLLPARSRQPKRAACSRRLSIRTVTNYIRNIFVRGLLKRTWGKLLARSFPHITHPYFILFATIARNPRRSAGALIAQMATVHKSVHQMRPEISSVIMADAPRRSATLMQRRGKQSLNGIMRGASIIRKTSTKA